MTATPYDPARDIPDLAGKVILVTGGTNGLGRETVLNLVSHGPRKVIFTGRNKAAADDLIQECHSRSSFVDVEFVSCDMTSLEATRTAARSIRSDNDQLHIILGIAGVMAVPPALTKDGYEIQFGISHVAHALLIKLLLPLLKSSASNNGDARIVLFSSEAAEGLAPSGGIQFDNLRKAENGEFMGGWRRYGQAKLANVLYARALAKHYPEITSVSIHPGVAWTGLVTSLGTFDRWFVKATTFMKYRPPHEVAWNGCWAATAPKKDGTNSTHSQLPLVQNGLYYKPVGMEGPTISYLGDDALAERLWQWTEKELSAWPLNA